MPLNLVGNTVKTATNANSAYFSNKGAVITATPHQATAGEVITAFVVSRGASASPSPNSYMWIYSSDTSDITTATFDAEYPYNHTNPVHTNQRFVLDTPKYLVGGRYYWILLSRLPGTYCTRAESPAPHRWRSFAFTTGTSTRPETLNGVALTQVATTESGVAYVEIVNSTDRTTTVLSSTPTQPSYHVARFSGSENMAQGVHVDHNMFSSNGSTVTINTDGSFILGGLGNQTFNAKFSTDSGGTWGEDQTIAVIDLTA